MSLSENHIAKTVIRYIDTAITSPPEHQPLQDADKVYDSFVKDFERLSAGIAMKQVSQRKPDDPSYLPFGDPFAINLARLFLAFRAREQVPLALRPQPEPPLSLDSVVLAKVTKRTFNRVLFFIANANERASRLQRHGNDLISNRTFQRFVQAAPQLAALPPYVRRADDPHWMVRYSDQAIKTVRALLSIQAQLDSVSATATEQPSQPSGFPVLSLDSAAMKDVTHKQFLDVLNSALQSARMGYQMARQAPPPDLESGSDTCCEQDSEDQGEWDTESDGPDVPHEGDVYNDADDSDSSFDYDVSTDDEAIELVPKAELLDEFNDVTMFESEEDYQRAFMEWNANEADEPLIPDVLGPLLDSPYKETREFTIALLQEVLGVAKAPIPEMKRNIQVVLRELRRLYRMAHTRPWRYSSEPDYQRTITPFVYCYSVLSDTAFMMRSFSMMVFNAPDGEEAADMMKTGLDSIKKSLRQIPATLEGLPECQTIMNERTRIARIRLNAYMDALTHITQIMIRYEKAFTVVGPRYMPQFNVKHHKCLDLNTAVQNFKGFDNSRLGMEYFPEFPATLIKGCNILDTLDRVHRLKFITEFRKNEDVKKAANTAGELLRKWHQRSVLQGRNSLFVVLKQTL